MSCTNLCCAHALYSGRALDPAHTILGKQHSKQEAGHLQNYNTGQLLAGAGHTSEAQPWQQFWQQWIDFFPELLRLLAVPLVQVWLQEGPDASDCKEGFLVLCVGSHCRLQPTAPTLLISTTRSQGFVGLHCKMRLHGKSSTHQEGDGRERRGGGKSKRKCRLGKRR